MRALDICIPMHNEERVLPLLIAELMPIMEKISSHLATQSTLIFVDDGSSDNSVAIASDVCEANGIPHKILVFSRNFGKESALVAALRESDGDLCCCIDADLQDPPELIPKMIECVDTGFDIAVALRTARKSDTFFKRNLSKLFYFMHERLASDASGKQHGDYRLFKRHVVVALNKFDERQLYMKGLFNWIGYETAYVGYSRPERVAGTSKFTIWSLIKLATEGFVNFSILPLRFFSVIGLIIVGLAFVYGFYIFLLFFLGYNLPDGYPSLMIAILFIGGVQLLGVGLLGEYVGRTFMESKKRPAYLIKRIITKTNSVETSR